MPTVMERLASLESDALDAVARQPERSVSVARSPSPGAVRRAQRQQGHGGGGGWEAGGGGGGGAGSAPWPSWSSA